MPALQPTLEELRKAQEAIAKVVRHTPLLPSRTFSEMTGAQIYLKAENLQRTGSFKIRGAANRIAHLTEGEHKHGVIAASAGNHSQGVAFAATAAGVASTVVMPLTASIPKVEATRGYGANVVLHGQSFDEAQAEAKRLAQSGPVFIPGFDDLDVIAGQGTLGLEVCADLPEIEAVVVPVGGGGLIAGVATAVKGLSAKTKVYGVQAAACPSAAAALKQGRPTAVHARPTIADGIAVGMTGERTLPIIQRYVDEIVTVSEEEIAHAVALLLERSKLLVEGAGAVGLAALLAKRLPCEGTKTVVVLSGGNIDLPVLERVVNHGLVHAGRIMVLRVAIRDAPGQLARLLDLLAEARVNIIDVTHRRRVVALPVGIVQTEISAETRNAAHAHEVALLLKASGYVEQPAAIGQAAANTLDLASVDAADVDA